MPIHSDPTKMEEGELIYALDIGTRSVIGMLGALEQGRIRILALEKQPHARRAMLDGQIEDIDQVAGAVSLVTHRLEEASGRRLTRACVAAAGRALRTELGRRQMRNKRCPPTARRNSGSSWWATLPRSSGWTTIR